MQRGCEHLGTAERPRRSRLAAPYLLPSKTQCWATTVPKPTGTEVHYKLSYKTTTLCCPCHNIQTRQNTHLRLD